MAQPQQNISLVAPGFFGINTQDSPLDMEIQFASEANNCVIDELGRIGSRRGFQAQTTNPSVLNDQPIKQLFEFIRQDNGGTYVFACGNKKIFLQQQSAPFELVELTLPTAYVINDDDWQFATLDNKCFLVQQNQKPLLFDPVVDDTTLREWVEYPQLSKGETVWPNVIHSAFGRLWVGDFDDDSGVFEWSGLLDGENWSTAGHGGAQTGLFWPSGYDSITAITAHNDFLVIFGQRNILLYTTTADVASTLALNDTIEGIGCVARDSIAPTGIDFMFCDSTGVRSLNRTIQEKSLPIGDISRNVRDDFQFALQAEAKNDIKAVFHVEDSFYVTFLPSNPLTYCFDVRKLLPDGSGRATTWTQIRPRCGVRLESRVTLFGGQGGVYNYRGGADVAAVGEDPQAIPMSYITHPLDFGDPSTLKFPKQVDVVVINAFGGDLTLKWGYDYKRAVEPQRLDEALDSTLVQTVYYPVGTDPTTEGAGEYVDPLAPNSPNLGFYTPSSEAVETIQELRYNIWGSGRNVRLGFFADALGALSIQQVDIQALRGRIL